MFWIFENLFFFKNENLNVFDWLMLLKFIYMFQGYVVVVGDFFDFDIEVLRDFFYNEEEVCFLFIIFILLDIFYFLRQIGLKNEFSLKEKDVV